MAQKLYDLAVKTGEYQDNQGNKKGRWQNVGAVMKGDDGSKFIILAKWFNPAGVPDLSGRGGEAVLLSMFEPKGANDNGGGDQRQTPRQQPPMDDDIPF